MDVQQTKETKPIDQNEISDLLASESDDTLIPKGYTSQLDTDTKLGHVSNVVQAHA